MKILIDAIRNFIPNSFTSPTYINLLSHRIEYKSYSKHPFQFLVRPLVLNLVCESENLISHQFRLKSP